MVHSTILVPSLWRVFPITLSSQTDMPSLTTVTLDKEYAFEYKKTVQAKSPSSSFSLSFLDITPALQWYLSFPLSFTYHLITCSLSTHSIQYQLHPTIKPHPTTIPLPPSSQTNHINPSFLPHTLLSLSPPPYPISSPHSIQSSTLPTNPTMHVDAHTKS